MDKDLAPPYYPSAYGEHGVIDESLTQNNVLKMFDDLVSKESIEAEKQRLHDILQVNDPDILKEEIRHFEDMHKAAIASYDTEKAKEVAYRLLEAEDRRRQAFAEREDLVDMNNPACEGRRLVLESSDPRAHDLMKMLTEGPQMRERHFISRTVLLEHRSDPYTMITVRTTLASKQPLELPLSNFVYAEDMISWEQGRGTVRKVNNSGVTKTSTHIIDEYSQRSTEAPPIEKVTAFLQPNGLVLFATEGGSHRTAAAIKRGDPSIKAATMDVRKLAANIFDLKDEKVYFSHPEQSRAYVPAVSVLGSLAAHSRAEKVPTDPRKLALQQEIASLNQLEKQLASEQATGRSHVNGALREADVRAAASGSLNAVRSRRTQLLMQLGVMR